MSTESGWAMVIRGTARKMCVVWIISRTASHVTYEAPNPWSFRDGDSRKGWSKPQRAPLADVAGECGTIARDAIDRIIAAIGMPPSTKTKETL